MGLCRFPPLLFHVPSFAPCAPVSPRAPEGVRRHSTAPAPSAGVWLCVFFGRNERFPLLPAAALPLSPYSLPRAPPVPPCTHPTPRVSATARLPRSRGLARLFGRNERSTLPPGPSLFPSLPFPSLPFRRGVFHLKTFSHIPFPSAHFSSLILLTSFAPRASVLFLHTPNPEDVRPGVEVALQRFQEGSRDPPPAIIKPSLHTAGRN